MNEPQIKEALEKGIRAARRGRKAPAQRLLGQVVQAQPDNEEAWLWLSRVVEQPADRAACLNRVIELNPNNSWAAEQLAELQAGPSPDAESAVEMPTLGRQSDIEIQVLQCPNCGTPLDVHGGRSTKTIVCSGCGDIIDLTPEQAQIVGQTNKAQPSRPIDLGAEVRFWNEDHMVIGWIRFVGWDDEDRWEWEEWLLHSAGGEFRWLSYGLEEGFMLYKPVEPTGPFNPHMDSTIPVPGGNARVTERAQAEITGLKGELTWQAKVGDKLGYLDAERGNALYSVEFNDDALNIYGGRAISEAKVWKAFGRDDLVAEAKEYQQKNSVNWKPVFAWAAAYCLILTAIGLFLGGMLANSGTEIYAANTQLSMGETSTRTLGPIPISQANRMHRLTLETESLPSNPVRLNLSLKDSQDREFSMTTEQFIPDGEKSREFLFKPVNSGQASLILALQDTPAQPLALTVKLKQGFWDGAFFYASAGLSFLAMLVFIFLWIVQLIRQRSGKNEDEVAA